MMKKITVAFLSVLTTLCLVACGDSGNGQPSGENPSMDADDLPESQPESTGTSGGQPESTGTSGGQPEGIEASGSQPESGENPEAQGAKVLVVYFSATNTTEGVAQHIANGLSADIYEIVPEEPYTDADLNYNDNNSRTTIEMNDPSARPGISGSVENMEQYTIVFLGYPIWWGEAPRIVSTFVESYDLTGKTIVPFCTSGGSGVGSSATNLEKLTKGADWLSGKRLNGSDSQDTVMEWVNSLGLDFGE